MSKRHFSSDCPYESRYIDVHGSKIRYIDEGSGDPILFLHGNPTSSYLWRNIIPHLTALGRCIAPDLIGMGRSDKPDLEYRLVDHVKDIEVFIEAMGLQNLTLVVHDWGSAVGFHYAMRHGHNVKGMAFMEAILMPWLTWDMFLSDLPDVKKIFQGFRTPEVGWDMIVNKSSSSEVIRRCSRGNSRRPLAFH